MAIKLRMDDEDAPEKEPKKSTRAEKFSAEHGTTGPKIVPGDVKDVEIDEPDDDELDDDEPAGATRLGKKRSRYAAVRREAEETRTQLDAERRRADQAESRAQSLQTYAQGVQAMMGPGGGREDPHDAELKRLAKEQDLLVTAFQSRRDKLPANQDLPAEEYSRMRVEVQALQDKRQGVMIQKALRGHQAGPSQQDVANQVQEAQLRAKYPDVFADPKVHAYANALAGEYLQAGKSGPSATEEVMAKTREVFRLGSRGNQDVERARYGGVPSGLASPGSTGSKRVYRLEPGEKLIAHARFSKLPPEEAERRWVNTVGKRILEKRDGARRGT